MAYKPQRLEVAAGGTGAATLTDGGIVLGNGTAAVTVLAVGATGTVLTGVTASDPAFSATPTVTSLTLGAGTALSNYVEGTFTPTLTNTGSAPTVTYNSQVGTYTRVGNRVMINCIVRINTYTAGSGNTQISSLPFTSEATTQNSTNEAFRVGTVTFGASVLYYTSSIAPNTTVIAPNGIRTGTTELQLVAAGTAASSEFRTSFILQV